MILTGRPVEAAEALQIGLANRVVPTGSALTAAIELAQQITRFPQLCMNTDRLSAYGQWDHPLAEALLSEGQAGLSPRMLEAAAGAARFVAGEGRGGTFE